MCVNVLDPNSSVPFEVWAIWSSLSKKKHFNWLNLNVQFLGEFEQKIVEKAQAYLICTSSILKRFFIQNRQKMGVSFYKVIPTMTPSIRTYLLINLLLSVTLITSLAIICNLFLAHKDIQLQLDVQLIRSTLRTQAIFSTPVNPTELAIIQHRLRNENKHLAELKRTS